MEFVMQWLSDLWTGENRILQLAALAVCVLAVLVALAIVYRLIFANRLRVPGGRTRQPRLGLVDAFSLDGQRQLVLVRRDNVEHLVMIGGPNDVLLESQINRALAASRESGLAASGPAAPLRRRAEAVAVAPPSVSALEPDAPPAAPAAPPTLAPPAAPAASAADVRPIPMRAAAKPLASRGPQLQLTPVAPQAPPPVADRKVEAAQTAAIGLAPAPARRVMPPPIAPPGRANVARLPEKPREASQPGQPVAAPPLQPPKAEKTDWAAPAPESAPLEASPATASAAPKPVPRTATVSVAPVVNAAPPTDLAPMARAEAHPPPPPPPRVETAKPASLQEPKTPPKPEIRAALVPPHPAPAAVAKPASPAPAPAEKRQANADDPFAGLDSLEAEMAKLLGREKLN